MVMRDRDAALEQAETAIRGADGSMSPGRRAFLKVCSALAGGAFVGVLSEGLSASPVSQSSTPAELVRFGKTELYVSRMCQGTAFRNRRASPNDQLGQMVYQRCLELGVNFFDSSNMYNWGGAERALAKAISSYSRDKLVICTKVWPGLQTSSPNAPSRPAPVTREFAFRALEGSLRRLGTDYVDLYLLHLQDPLTSLDDLVDTMDAIVRSGKVRYWGVSNHSGEQIDRLAELSGVSGRATIAGTQDYYNILARDTEEYLFPTVRRTGIGMMAYSPLAGGELVPGRTADPEMPIAGVLAALDNVAKEFSVSRSQVATAWVLSNPAVTCVVSGAGRPEHVDDNFEGTRLVLPEEAIAALSTASNTYHELLKKKKQG
jgi:aryl-alcohol dehydrogenase-like predicted oxidoreductase